MLNKKDKVLKSSQKYSRNFPPISRKRDLDFVCLKRREKESKKSKQDEKDGMLAKSAKYQY